MITTLEEKSLKLKELLSCYSTEWFLGYISFLFTCIADNSAQDVLGRLSSPKRQLYYLGGLLITSKDNGIDESYFDPIKWNEIVNLLNEIEKEYDSFFLPKENKSIDEEWIKIRKVAFPTFLTYFNQGIMNYEEQTIAWVENLYSKFNDKIKAKLDLDLQDFINFHFSLDSLYQKNFNGYSGNKLLLRDNWQKYSKRKLSLKDDIPEIFREEFETQFELQAPSSLFMVDKGVISRFHPEELVTEDLSIDKIGKILNSLSCKRELGNFIYYTETKPGNPLYRYPIIELKPGYYQVFEVEQVIQAINMLFESVCTRTEQETSKLSNVKGELLESRIVELFKNFFPKDLEFYESYYVDGSEQDILLLWKNYAFIIEAKGYKVAEPFRNPEMAYKRIKNDFTDSIGYAYEQVNRVQQKFINQEELVITNKKGKVLKVIDTTKYEDNDFGIIVNLHSFGYIQNDLTILLPLEDEDYPWVVKVDDLEVFLLTLKQLKKKPKFFIEYLEFRETLHGKLLCSDELELCGAFLTNLLDSGIVENLEFVLTIPDFTEIFDKVYRKGMGFKNEKYLEAKKDGKSIFW